MKRDLFDVLRHYSTLHRSGFAARVTGQGSTVSGVFFFVREKQTNCGTWPIDHLVFESFKLEVSDIQLKFFFLLLVVTSLVTEEDTR